MEVASKTQLTVGWNKPRHELRPYLRRAGGSVELPIALPRAPESQCEKCDQLVSPLHHDPERKRARDIGSQNNRRKLFKAPKCPIEF